MSASDATVGERLGSKIKTLDELKKRLQEACQLELSTIPLYLFALYSIKDGADAFATIREVVVQEMFHLALVGNTLCAVGGRPLLYDPSVVPDFSSPSTTLMHTPIPLDLLPAIRPQLDTFRKIERPVTPPASPLQSAPLLSDFESIGQFYEAIKEGLKSVGEFTGSTSGQFTADDNLGFVSDELSIKDLPAALAALDVVIEQGEGNANGSITGGQGNSGGERSHYQAFTDLYNGPEPDCFPVAMNPTVTDCKGDHLHPVMLACDGAYMYLLITMEKCFAYEGPKRGRLVKNIDILMKQILVRLAKFLVKQKLPGSQNENAGPPFSYHEFSPRETAFQQLQEMISAAVSNYSTELQPVKTAAKGLIDAESL